MGQFVDVLFSDYAPDRGGAPWPENPGYLVDAVNVRFTPNGYRSTYVDAAAATATSSAGGLALSAVGFANVTNPRHYVGTVTKIFESDDFGATWNDNAGAAYSATDWDWALFGLRVIAVDGVDNPQTKSITDPIANNFADLAGSPPVAGCVARVRDSLVLGNLSPTSGISGMQWSSINDPTDWPTPGSSTALARQAGSFVLPQEYGSIQQIVGGEKFGLVFQERAITRMTYVGGDIQFTFDIYEKGQGTGSRRGAVYVGGFVYFLNSCGVFRTDGYGVEFLSLGKIDDAIIAKLLGYGHEAGSFGGSSSTGVGVAYDARTKSILWKFNDDSGAPFMLSYDLALKQFRLVQLVGTCPEGTLYSVTNGASVQNAHALPFFIDSAQKLRTLSYLTSISTTLRTGYIELEPGAITEVTGVEVLGAKMSPTPTISSKSVSDASDIDLSTSGYTDYVKSNLDSLFRNRVSGRYHSFRYAESAQTQAALIRGLRVYFEIKSQR